MLLIKQNADIFLTLNDILPEEEEILDDFDTLVIKTGNNGCRLTLL